MGLVRSKNQAPTNALPVDLWEKIFSLLPKSDAISLAYVCRSWNQTSCNATFWRGFCQEIWGPAFVTNNKNFTNSKFRSHVAYFGKSDLVYVPPCFSMDINRYKLSLPHKAPLTMCCPVLGDFLVGKTTAVRKLSEPWEDAIGTEYDPTIDIVITQTFTELGVQLSLSLVDLFFGCEFMPSQEEIETHTYSNRHCFIIMYSVVSRSSFESVYPLIQRARRRYPNGCPPILILGNKIDLKSQAVVSPLEGLEFASKHCCAFSEVSLQSGENCVKVRNTILLLAAEYRYCKETSQKLQKAVKEAPKIDISKYIEALKNSGYCLPPKID